MIDRTSKEESLFSRAERILDGRANGFGLPILRHLALRRHAGAMLSIANRETDGGLRSEVGSPATPFSPSNLMYRAYRLGEPNAAQNLALTYFNIGDLQGYRMWMRRAAKAGDAEADVEISRFEMRKSHGLARRLGRLRPPRRDGN